MATPLVIPSGVVKSRSPEGVPGRWVDAQGVRFTNKQPEKKKGIAALNSFNSIQGTARGMAAWNVLTGTPRYAIGTETKLYGSDAAGAEPNELTINDYSRWLNQMSITAGRGAITVNVGVAGTGTLGNNPFATTNLSPTVVVTHTAHGHVTGDVVVFSGAAVVAGLTLNGPRYSITRLSANTYSITHTSNANATTTGGGAAVVYFYLLYLTGTDINIVGFGSVVLGGVTLSSTYEVVGNGNGFPSLIQIIMFPRLSKVTLGANPFATVNTSTTVTVTAVAHGRATGDVVWINSVVSVGGVSLSGEYVITVTGVDTFTIVGAPAATSTTTGGSSTVVYYASPATSTVVNGGNVSYTAARNGPFNTTNGSNDVLVTDYAHGRATGDRVEVSFSLLVGGLSMDGVYTISVLTANTYTVTHSSTASSTDIGGGGDLVTLVYGLGSGSAAAPGARIWSISHYGEDAIANPRGKPIYYWDVSAGNVAVIIANAPTDALFTFVTDERIIIALRPSMTIDWSDQDNPSVWTPTSTNQAGQGRKVGTGSKLVSGTKTGDGVNLIWSDGAVFTHQYVPGSRFIYDTRLDSSGIGAGIAGPLAFAVTPIGVVWMGIHKFYIWNGSTQSIPNSEDIETWVYENMSSTSRELCFAVYDEINNSVDFHFPGSGQSDTLTILTLNMKDFSWVNDAGTFTAGCSGYIGSDGKRHPIKVAGVFAYLMETGLAGVAGAALVTRIVSAPFDLGDGIFDVFGFDPNFKRQTGALTLTLNAYDRDPETITDTDAKSIAATGAGLVDFHVSGRHVSLSLTQTLLSGDWAWDTPRIEVKPSGDRR